MPLVANMAPDLVDRVLEIIRHGEDTNDHGATAYLAYLAQEPGRLTVNDLRWLASEKGCRRANPPYGRFIVVPVPGMPGNSAFGVNPNKRCNGHQIPTLYLPNNETIHYIERNWNIYGQRDDLDFLELS